MPPRVRELARPRLVRRGGAEASDAITVGDRAQALGVSPLQMGLMLGRGVAEESEQRRLLDPRLRDLHAPQSMAGFEEALEVLIDARDKGLRVGIFGDYDVDGVTTTTILSSFLEALGVDVVCRVATREGGYGFGLDPARELLEAGAQVVLTGDCGTSDHEALGWLQERGVPVVVIDHHQVPETMPPAAALLNPHQPGCEFPFKGMCSAGVAFYLCAALRTRLASSSASKLPDPRAWLDLVALGTVCDMVPLHDNNRIFVRHGLRVMSERRRPGLRALLARAGVSQTIELDEGHLGFQLGPRINAPGRLDSAAPALALLRARSNAEAEPLAAKVEMFNAQRRHHQAGVVEQASAMLNADPRIEERAGLVVGSEEWLPGIVGIAASGLASRYRRPALVVAIDRSLGEARGSGRTWGEVDVRGALAQCADVLRRYGGHKAAAGFSLDLDKVDALREAFDAAVAKQVPAGAPEPVDEYDGELLPSDVTHDLVDELTALAPYGVGFTQPVFAAEEVVVRSVREVAGRHMAMMVDAGGRSLEAMAFDGLQEAKVEAGDKVGLLFTPTRREFRGTVSLQMRVERFWGVD